MRPSLRAVEFTRRKSSTMILKGHGLSRFNPIPATGSSNPKIVCGKNGW